MPQVDKLHHKIFLPIVQLKSGLWAQTLSYYVLVVSYIVCSKYVRINVFDWLTLRVCWQQLFKGILMACSADSLSCCKNIFYVAKKIELTARFRRRRLFFVTATVLGAPNRRSQVAPYSGRSYCCTVGRRLAVAATAAHTAVQ